VCLATGVGLWRSQPLAIKAAYGVTLFLTMQSVAVLFMARAMLWRNDPTATRLRRCAGADFRRAGDVDGTVAQDVLAATRR
jgi:hypothetical protein